MKIQKVNTTLSCRWNCQIQKLVLKPIIHFKNFCEKEIPIISPLYHHGNFVIDFWRKAELFNSFFSEQCSLLKSSSKLSNNLVPQTDQSLTSIKFSQDDILKIIQNLNPNKAHGRGKMSICMIKICANSLWKPLEMIFESCIIKGKFLSEWKKAN